ncbi:MAG TPA: hypothetical protein V6D07_07715 [Trichocoleus sp.]
MNNIPDIALIGSMSSQQLELYNRILMFEIDELDVSFPFSKRLARDHGWSLTYTQRVIEEYKKFLFLASEAGHSVTPSDAVDQAWHLHLTYTHSYWDDLCGQVLQKPLHHHPTKGGSSQREFFGDCYQKTLNSYEEFFGYPPPSDIWQPSTIRFAQVGQFRQVNVQDFWFMPKPSRIFRLVSLKLSHLSWLQAMAISLLALGCAVNWHFLYHQVISISSDAVNFLINQPAFAQVYSSADSHLPSQPKVESFQITTWVMSALSFFKWLAYLITAFYLFIVICAILRVIFWPLNSWCPKCKCFGMVKRKTHTLWQPTEQHEGTQMVTKCCSRCNYKKHWHESIPRLNSNDSGCAVCM